MRLMASFCALIFLVGCGAPEQDSRPVDPQVLRDVIDATFMVPGTEMLRAMRVQAFARNKGIEECGGKGGPLDSTAARVDQSKFPDLDLIRTKGFTEDNAVKEEDQRLASISGSCKNLVPNIPGWSASQAIGAGWNDVALSAEQQPRVRSHVSGVATCLSSRTGLKLRAGDPISGYLNAVNAQRASDHQTLSDGAAAVAYADCTKPYFDALRVVLMKRRGDAVERNREALQDYARGLVKAGYVP